MKQDFEERIKALRDRRHRSKPRVKLFKSVPKADSMMKRHREEYSALLALQSQVEDWENEKVMIKMPDETLAPSPIVSPSTLTRKSDPSLASSVLDSE